MGIIQRQSLKNAIISYAGVLIGAISVLYVYSMDDEIYGLAQFIYSTATFFFALMNFGMTPSVVKYFPYFKTEKNDGGLLLSALTISSLMFGASYGLYCLAKPVVISQLANLGFNIELLTTHETVIFLLSYFILCTSILSYYSSNYGRIVIPEILSKFSFKIFLPILILVYVFYDCSRSFFTWSILLFFVLSTLSIFIYTVYIGRISFQFKMNRILHHFNTMKNFMVFNLFQSVGSILAFSIDTIMIPLLISLSANGLYTKMLFVTSIIDLPLVSIEKISAPIISKSWKENNLKEIQKIYKKASNNLLVLGVFLFLLIAYTLKDVFNISINPASFEGGFLIFLCLAVGKLFNMMTSVNTSIISYSKHYRFNFVFILILAISNCIGNYYFIQSMGLIGAAVATALSLVFFNVLKLLFIYWKFNILPFTSKAFMIFVLGGVFYYLMSFIPAISNPFLAIVCKGFLITILYWPIVIYFKFSEDLNQMLYTFIKQFKDRKL